MLSRSRYVVDVCSCVETAPLEHCTGYSTPYRRDKVGERRGKSSLTSPDGGSYDDTVEWKLHTTTYMYVGISGMPSHKARFSLWDPLVQSFRRFWMGLR